MPLMVHSTCRAPALHAGQRVGHRHAEVVVAVHGEDRLVRRPARVSRTVRNIWKYSSGVGVADRVGQVDGGGAGLDRRLHAAAQVVDLGAGGVLRRPLHVVAPSCGRASTWKCTISSTCSADFCSLCLRCTGRGGDEGVDARPPGVLHRLAGPVDVLLAGARQPAHHRALDALGDLGDGLEVALRGDREAGLDDVDAHLVEEVGDLQLLLEGHGGAGALLAVAQRRVEDEDAVVVGGVCPASAAGPTAAGMVVSGMCLVLVSGRLIIERGPKILSDDLAAIP